MKLPLELFFLYLLTEPLLAGLVTKKHTGIAKNSKGTVVYFEKHEVQFLGKKVKKSQTLYYDRSGTRKIASLVSDYSSSIKMPTYEFIDLRSGYKEGLRRKNGKYIIYHLDENKQEISKPLSTSKQVFSSQGWHYFLVNNLSMLEEKDVVLRLIVPSQLDYYTFAIRKAEVAGNLLSTHLELSNWVINLFAPKMKLVYDRTQKKLIKFVGLSNIPTDTGEPQEVTIDYQY